MFSSLELGFSGKVIMTRRKPLRTERGFLIGILTSIFLTFCTTPSLAQDMTTIDSFISQNRNADDSEKIQFVGFRCASLYMTMGIYLEGDQINKHLWEWNQAMQNAIFSTAFSLSDESSSTDYITGQLEKMSNSYRDRFNAERARTGNGFNDNIIKSDLKTCGKRFIRRR
jgi:hypothetical protein